jgi:hypothetical protein
MAVAAGFPGNACGLHLPDPYQEAPFDYMAAQSYQL